MATALDLLNMMRNAPRSTSTASVPASHPAAQNGLSSGDGLGGGGAASPDRNAAASSNEPRRTTSSQAMSLLQALTRAEPSAEQRSSGSINTPLVGSPPARDAAVAKAQSRGASLSPKVAAFDQSSPFDLLEGRSTSSSGRDMDVLLADEGTAGGISQTPGILSPIPFNTSAAGNDTVSERESTVETKQTERRQENIYTKGRIKGFSPNIHISPIALLEFPRPSASSPCTTRLIGSTTAIFYALKSGKIRVLDKQTGEKGILKRHSRPICDLRVSPASPYCKNPEGQGGTRLASAGLDARVAFYELKGPSDQGATDTAWRCLQVYSEITTGQSLGMSVRWHPNNINLAAYSYDTKVKFVDLSSYGQGADATQGQQNAEYVHDQLEMVVNIAFSPDGKRFMVASETSVVVYDLVEKPSIQLVNPKLVFHRSHIPGSGPISEIIWTTKDGFVLGTDQNRQIHHMTVGDMSRSSLLTSSKEGTASIDVDLRRCLLAIAYYPRPQIEIFNLQRKDESVKLDLPNPLISIAFDPSNGKDIHLSTVQADGANEVTIPSFVLDALHLEEFPSQSQAPTSKSAIREELGNLDSPLPGSRSPSDTLKHMVAIPQEQTHTSSVAAEERHKLATTPQRLPDLNSQDKLTEEIQRMNERMHTTIEHSFAKEMDTLYKRLEESRLAHQAGEIAREEKLLQMVSDTLTNNVNKVMSDHIEHGLAKLIGGSRFTDSMSEAIMKDEFLTKSADLIATRVRAMSPQDNDHGQALKSLAMNQKSTSLLLSTLEQTVRSQNQEIQDLKDLLKDQKEVLSRIVTSQTGTNGLDTPQKTQRTSAGQLKSAEQYHHLEMASKPNSIANSASTTPSAHPTTPSVKPETTTAAHVTQQGQSIPVQHKGPAEGHLELEDRLTEILHSKSQPDLLAFLRPMQVQHALGDPLHPEISQPVILSLIHSLSTRLEESSDIRLTWIEYAVRCLHPNDPSIASFIPSLVPRLIQRIETQQAQLDVYWKSVAGLALAQLKRMQS